MDKLKELFWRVVWSRPLFYVLLATFTVGVVLLLVYLQFFS